MKTNGKIRMGRALFAAMLCLLGMSLAGTGWCGDEAGTSVSGGEGSKRPAESDLQAKDQQPPRVRMPKFAPPKRGAPVGRIAGGARGEADGVPTLVVLTPEQTALTAMQSPTVYWYTSQVAPWPVELTVTEPRAVVPLLVRRLPTPKVGGIQRVSLQDLGGQLEPDRDYRWYIALVRDDERRSRDVLAYGGVRWEEPSEDLLTAVGRAAPGEVPSHYAEAGYWYEALDTAIRLAESGPYRVEAVAARDSLLAQVGLDGLLRANDTD